ncbi:glucose-specific PTS transporter subunit IIBC [Brevibacillus fulvus]|uniref:PTS system D-glucosamine-specific IIC component n=1 Tax=Brevibacillus fulvus TaxID=1125967 RepID=A0A938Y325_9BACL|nr:glucose-specific PTS transporter subunit IIBC [Brevibacillus fulvus]MBM7590320.1 PTS system D-glucosamine-specific IIC component [Brevibacillus fulvus]
MFKKLFQLLQQIGRALMTPVAVLPAAGLLLRFGDKDLLNMPFIKDAGGIIFDNLPLIFAVGVAIGLTGGDGVAALAAVIGYFVLTKTLDDFGAYLGLQPPYQGAEHLINMGVFAGILIGIVSAIAFNRFYNIKLHPVLGFFAGKRFVPIITALASLLLGIVFSFIWPPIQQVIDAASNWVMNSAAGPFFFGLIQRLLIPFGLHHIFQTPFYFTMGQYIDPATGQVVTGDMARFFAGDPTAGRFMAGLFPYMIFGLPAAALAMIHEARPEKRKAVSGVLISAGLTSMLTGITEPIEFSFLFVAPALFFIHALLAGLSFTAMDWFGVKHGYTFSGGGIDYILNYGLSTNGWIVIPVGLVLAVIYYALFRFAIRIWDLKTPGREAEDEAVEGKQTQPASTGSLAADVLRAFGGKENLDVLDACITRLRVTVNDPKQVDTGELKRLGAAGVLEMGNNIQAIFGTQSDSLKEQMKAIMAGKEPAEAARDVHAAEDKPGTVFVGQEEILAPLTGEVVDITEVPDQVFAGKMMGDGFAVKPADGLVVSPVNGKVTTLFPTKHAVGLQSDTGLEVLVHVGIDTVKLEGKGFEVLCKDGQLVEAGTPLLKVDLAYLQAQEKPTITPIVFTNLQANQTLKINHGLCEAGKTTVAAVTSK